MRRELSSSGSPLIVNPDDPFELKQGEVVKKCKKASLITLPSSLLYMGL
jgi:hypothetical protein